MFEQTFYRNREAIFMKNPLSNRHSSAGPLISAFVLYVSLSGYLFWPHFGELSAGQYLLPFSFTIAALGCFVLSRRWISSFSASVFAGAVYAFSPFSLSLAAYHPAATIPLAMVPWLFCPATYWQRWSAFSFLACKQTKPHDQKRSPDGLAFATTILLSILPLCVISLFFSILASRLVHFFPLANIQMTGANFAALIIPLSRPGHTFAFSFYHIGNIILLMGLFLYLAVPRICILALFAGTLCLSFANPILSTPGVVWALIPLLFCSILIGSGIQVLAWAGKADAKWILACVLTASVLALATFLAGYKYTSVMYSLAALLCGSILCIANSKMRLHLVRWVLLYAGLTADILLGGSKLIDQIL
jgi:hypothetical protein